MKRLSRFLAIALLAMFAASTVAHGARAATMALAMSHGEMAGDMGDCDGCPLPDEGKALSCGQLCLTAFAALPVPAGVDLASVTTDPATSSLKAMSGLTGPPELQPPRSTIPG